MRDETQRPQGKSSAILPDSVYDCCSPGFFPTGPGGPSGLHILYFSLVRHTQFRSVESGVLVEGDIKMCSDGGPPGQV